MRTTTNIANLNGDGKHSKIFYIMIEIFIVKLFDLNFAYFLQFHFPNFHLKYAIWETLHMNNKFST